MDIATKEIKTIINIYYDDKSKQTITIWKFYDVFAYKPSFATTISEYINHDGSINEEKSYTTKGYKPDINNTECSYREQETLITYTYHDNSTMEVQKWEWFDENKISSSLFYIKITKWDSKGISYEEKIYDAILKNTIRQKEIENFLTNDEYKHKYNQFIEDTCHINIKKFLSKNYHECYNEKYKKFHRKYHEYNKIYGIT